MPAKYICVVCEKKMYKDTSAMVTAIGIMCHEHYMAWVFNRIVKLPDEKIESIIKKERKKYERNKNQ